LCCWWIDQHLWSARRFGACLLESRTSNISTLEGHLAVETARAPQAHVFSRIWSCPMWDGLERSSSVPRHAPATGSTPVIRPLEQGGTPADRSATPFPWRRSTLSPLRCRTRSSWCPHAVFIRRRVVTQIQRDRGARNLPESQRQSSSSTSQLEERIRVGGGTRQLSRLVSTDSMTGLYSRRRWFELPPRSVSRIRAQFGTLTLLMADLDLFKGSTTHNGHDIATKSSASSRACFAPVAGNRTLSVPHRGRGIFVCVAGDTDGRADDDRPANRLGMPGLFRL